MNEDVKICFTRRRSSGYYHKENRIELSYEEMKEDMVKDNLSFEKVFSETLPHKLLHHIMHRIEGNEASEWIDEISARKMYRKRKKFSIKHWIGGIYGYKEVKDE